MGTDIYGGVEFYSNGQWKLYKDLSKYPDYRSYDTFAVLALAGMEGRDFLNIQHSIAKNSFTPDDLTLEMQELWEDFGSGYCITYKQIKDYDFEQKVFDSRENNKEITLREAVCEDQWKVFNDMKELAKDFGDNNVRMVFWFD